MKMEAGAAGWAGPAVPATTRLRVCRSKDSRPWAGPSRAAVRGKTDSHPLPVRGKKQRDRLEGEAGAVGEGCGPVGIGEKEFVKVLIVGHWHLRSGDLDPLSGILDLQIG